MKNVLRFSTMFTLALVLTLASSFTFANVDNEKAIQKARSAAKNASPDDWKTLVKSAKLFIRKNIFMYEALSWLEKSIAINKNVVNLELLGDCYYKMENNRQAMISYVEAFKQVIQKILISILWLLKKR